MMKLKYVGSMSSAVLFDGRAVMRDQVFEVEDDQVAAGLLAQTDNYAGTVDDAAPRRKSKDGRL